MARLVVRLALVATLAPLSLGCDPASSPDDGGSSRVDAPIAPGTDAPLAPGTDAPIAPGSDAPVPASCNGPERTGEATYYAADGTGNCSFPASGDFVAAMNTPDWAGSEVCGTCAEIDGPDGSVLVRIVDRCPECPTGNLDLSMAAFAEIAPIPDGRVPITWREVPCPVSSGLVVAVDFGANPYYLAVNVRNVRHRIVSVERRLPSGSWVPLVRQTYNVWVESPVEGAPVTTMHLRITDSHRGVVETDVAVTPNLEVVADQLPSCTG